MFLQVLWPLKLVLTAFQVIVPDTERDPDELLAAFSHHLIKVMQDPESEVSKIGAIDVTKSLLPVRAREAARECVGGVNGCRLRFRAL